MIDDQIIESIKRIKTLDEERKTYIIKNGKRSTRQYSKKYAKRVDSILRDMRLTFFLLWELESPAKLGYESFGAFCKAEFDCSSTWFYTNQLRTAVLEKFVCEVQVGSTRRNLFDESGFKNKFPVLSRNLLSVDATSLTIAKQVWQGIKLLAEDHFPYVSEIQQGIELFLEKANPGKGEAVRLLTEKYEKILQENQILRQEMSFLSTGSTNKPVANELMLRIAELEKSLSLKSEEISNLQEQLKLNTAEELLRSYRDRQMKLVKAIHQYCITPTEKIQTLEILINRGTGACKDLLKNLRDLEEVS